MTNVKINGEINGMKLELNFSLENRNVHSILLCQGCGITGCSEAINNISLLCFFLNTF